MPKIVFIGAGSQFGATSFVDIMSFETLRDGEVVLVDTNPHHLGPVEAYCRKVIEHYKAPMKLSAEPDWRDGVLDGADYVITSFAQGGQAYRGEPYRSDICIPFAHGIRQTVADTVGIGGVMRMMRTAPELLAIARDMQQRCPGAVLINYVNPMSMLTRSLILGAPAVRSYGLCHNIQGGIREIARYIGCDHKDLRFEAAGVNHLSWFLRLEYRDGRDAYPDLLKAGEDPANYARCGSKFELLKQFGCWSGEGPVHVAEYVPWFLPRQADRESIGIPEREPPKDADPTGERWKPDSDLVLKAEGKKPLDLKLSNEYGVRIIHGIETDTLYGMHLNVMNDGLIENLPPDACVEVCCTVDRAGVHPHQAGKLPIPLAAMSGALANVETLASDAFLECDLEKACQACIIDPATAAQASPATIRKCFNELLEAERHLLEPYWGKTLKV